MINKMLPLLLACSVFLSGCGIKNQKSDSAIGYYFDTVVTLTGFSAPDVLEDALTECGRYEKLLSRTVEGSDVWNVNHAHGRPVEVSADTIEVLNLAIKISAASGGVFDVTVAPASELWNFKAAEPSVPDAGALAAAAERIDYTKIDISGNKVTLQDGMALDLGGIAKGFIADRIGEYLQRRGVGCAVLNFGGNIVTLGHKPDGSEWSIGIQDPRGETGKYLTEVKISGGAAVTSGTYERGFELGGVRYHHILDTGTGWPVQNGLVSLTVFAGSSALADALSTACFVLGIEKGSILLAEYDAEGIFVTDNYELILTDGVK